MRVFLAVTGILMSCVLAHAQKGELIIAGVGASKCSDVLKNYREGPKAMGYLMLTWAQGFWSSQNAAFLQAGTPMMKNLAGSDDARLKAMMDLCSSRPTDDFGLIVRDYFFELPSYPNPRAR